MNLFAQQGSMEGDKITNGLSRGLIDGVILSPRDVSLSSMKEKIATYLSINNQTKILFDPQLYAAFSPAGEGNKLGYLMEDYSEYFKPYRRNQLIKESSVEELLVRALDFQNNMPNLEALIAPNILIPRSLDSIETVISTNFIRLARKSAQNIKNKKPLYVTLSISREALFKERDVVEFVNELTALDDPPDGFYLLISSRNQDARSEIFNADIISVWMYLNYALSLNGFSVINGYSDLLAPVLSAAGGAGVATGWWSNLRSFSIERFEPTSAKGRLPIQRYLSCVLLNRITFYELDLLRDRFPEVLNGLPTDEEFPVGGDPDRSKEVLQSWEAINKLINSVEAETSGTQIALEKCKTAIETAMSIYDRIIPQYPLDQKSNNDHLQALLEGIQSFKKLAEIDFS